MKKKYSNLFFYFILWIVVLSVSACDNNIPSLDETAVSNHINISSFTADKSELTMGDSVMLTWKVNDEDITYDIDYVSIYPTVGNVGTSGTTQVKPSASTTYMLSVYVTGEVGGEVKTGKLIRQQSLQIAVLDANGDEVEEEPEAEICNDTLDNDRDTLVDCDDDDCFGDETCAPPAEPVYEFSSYSVSPDAPVIGDTVTVSWESNCELVIGSNFDGTKAANDSFSFVVAATSQTMTLYCYYNGGLEGSETILITATEPVVEEAPSFSARIKKFSVSPSTELIYGMEFYLEWEVENSTDVSLRTPGDTDYATKDESASTEPQVATADDAGDYYLKVRDANGIERTKKITIDVSEFSAGSSTGMSDIIERLPTGTDGEYYFISSTKIYHSTDYGVTNPALTTTGWSGDIKTLAVDSAGNLYLVTSKGVYLSTDKTTFTKIFTSSTGNVTAAYPRSTDSILVGTEEVLFEVFPESRGCEYDGTTVYITNGYCFYYYPFNGRNSFGSYHNGGELYVYKFIANAKDLSKVVIITSDGTFYSSDSGNNFVLQNSISATGGSWLGGSASGYLWNRDTDQVWSYDDEAGEFTSLGVDRNVQDINDVLKVGNKIFAATDHGVFYKFNSEWISTDLENGVNYLLSYKTVTATENEDRKYSRHIKTTWTLFALEAGGAKYTLSWDVSLQRKFMQDIGVQLR